MQKITNYRIIRTPIHETLLLEDVVQQYINEGWQPYGSVFVEKDRPAQVVVTYEKLSPKK